MRLEGDVLATQQFFGIDMNLGFTAFNDDFGGILLAEVIRGDERFGQGELSRPGDQRVPDGAGESNVRSLVLAHLFHGVLFAGQESGSCLLAGFFFRNAAGNGQDEKQ